MKAQHIIIEGPDGAGKTTLARILCEQGGYAYRHEGPPPGGNVSAFQHYMGVLSSLEEPTLLDRFHLGELVYGPLLRGASGLSFTDLTRLRSRLDDKRMQVILCLPPPFTAMTNWLERSKAGKELFSDQVLFCASYVEFFNIRHEAHVFYDYTRDPIDIDWLTTIRRDSCRAAS